MTTHRTRAGKKSAACLVFEFVRDNPYCTGLDVQSRFSFSSHIASMYLSRLKKRGLIHGEKLPNSKQWVWNMIEEDADDSPVQIIVKDWAGHPRDEWHRCFFGAST